MWVLGCRNFFLLLKVLKETPLHHILFVSLHQIRVWSVLSKLVDALRFLTVLSPYALHLVFIDE